MKKKVFSPILIICFSVLILSCCVFSIPLKLAAPSLLHDSENKTISWNSIKNAERYEIYVNDEFYQELEQAEGTIIFDYGKLNLSDGLYLVKVKAFGDGDNYTSSNFSNVVTLIVGEQGSVENTTISQYHFVNKSIKAPTNLNVSNTNLVWNSIDNASAYILGVFTNTNGVNYYSLTVNYASALDYLSGTDVLYWRVGAIYENDLNIYFSDNAFYDPLNKSIFTQNFFVFDGGVYDYYIENYAELQVLYHYSFITRSENYSFLVANSFKDLFLQSYSSNSTILNSFKETYGFVNTPYLTKLSSNSPLLNGLTEIGYTVKCKFYNNQTEPTIINNSSISTSYRTQDQTFTPYYEFVEYDDRASNYNDFESDEEFVYTTVTSSEELYWAVQEGITPRFTSTTCRAYLIYEKAKEVLNDIIKVGMTDYEKVLSIFDWISLNTTYDYNTYIKGNTVNPMQYGCYYLEGVFLDNQALAVCDGYSKAFVLLCNMEGIDCVRITGTAVSGGSSGGHAWNKVKLNNVWYMVDITWTEVLSEDDKTEVMSHQYFLVDHTDFENSHIESSVRKAKYDTYVDGGYLTYYKNTYFVYKNVKYDMFIESDAELSAFLEYCALKQIKGIDVMFSTNYLTNINNLSAMLLNNKPNYQTLGIHAMSLFVYDYSYIESVFGTIRQTNRGYIIGFEPTVMIKNSSTLNNWAKLITQNNITEYNRVSICIEESFLNGIANYDPNLTLLENFENIINDNYNFATSNLEVELTLVNENLSSEYATLEGNITIKYNIYDVKVNRK